MRWERLNDTSRKFWAAELQELIKMTDILGCYCMKWGEVSVVMQWRWGWAGGRSFRSCLSSRADSWVLPDSSLCDVCKQCASLQSTSHWRMHWLLSHPPVPPQKSALGISFALWVHDFSSSPTNVHLLWSMAAKHWCDQLPASREPGLGGLGWSWGRKRSCGGAVLLPVLLHQLSPKGWTLMPPPPCSYALK